MADSLKVPVCPTLVFGQFECALRDNDFMEAERLRLELETLGVRVQVDFWPPMTDSVESNSEGARHA